MKKIICVLGVLALPGCATIMEGTAQSVVIDSLPEGASCQVQRAGVPLGAVLATPGSVRIDKSKSDLDVTCQKAGFQTATIGQSSHFVGTTFGNILIGGLVGVAIDAATGADFAYPDNIQLTLAAMPAPVAVAPVQALPALALKPVEETTKLGS